MRVDRTLTSSLFILSLLFWPALAFADWQAGYDAFVQGDYATVLQELKPYAAQGSARAQQARPSLLYAQGQVVSSDVTPQMDNLNVYGVTPRRSISKGFYTGETQEDFELGVKYGPQANFSDWMDAYVEANPKQTHSDASSFYIQRFGPPPQEEIIPKQAFFDHVREQDPSATESAIDSLYETTFGFAQRVLDREKREQIPWYKLAMRGKPQAQYNLGLLYEQGQGVPQDYAQAIKWYRKAAKQGETSAQVRLGVLHEEGLGVPQDYAQAHMWFNLAAAQGDKKAASQRDQIAEKMSPFQIADAQQLAREWSAK